MSIPAEKIIELKELRIGNILSYKGQLVHITSLSLDIDDEYQDIIGFCQLGQNTKEKADWNRVLAGDLERVPLTLEILEKCGFIYYPRDDSDYSLNGRKGDIITWDSSCGEIYYNFCQMNNSADYLHQLQNLYFALTGEELAYKW